jgi:DNA-binding response OmpR family regulator
MTKHRLQGKTVLIVDDDEDILGSIALAIRAEGAEIVTAADGNEAISAAHSARPDAIVLDVMLPRRSGFLVLEKLQQDEKPAPVIMVTANQGKRHMAYAQSLGVRAYFYKPVALQRLVDKVVELCREDGAGASEADSGED